jgi:hypothetical protein
MDEQTKHLVASNLTIAYCSNRPASSQSGGGMTDLLTQTQPMSQEAILEVYRSFLAQLDGGSSSTGA